MIDNNRIKRKKPWIIISVILAVIACAVLIYAIPKVINSDPEPEPTTTLPFAAVEKVDRPTSGDLYCLEFTSFTGAFVEDGKNDKVENVVAILVENRSNQFLDSATVTYKVDSDDLVFNVTGLPAGEKAWVLESERTKIRENMEFVFVDCKSVFKPDAITETDVLEVSSDEHVLTVKNKSEDTLKNVCVYYKTMNDDGNFLGGITYMMSFDSLAPGEALQKESAHYTDRSRIVRFSFQTE